MRYDVNFILLGLLLVVIVAMIAMLFTYNMSYTGLRDKYNSAMTDIVNKSTELNTTIQDMTTKEAALKEKERLLLDYISELNLSKERETSLGSHFTELKGEKELLDEQLNQTRLERNSYANLYTRTKEDYDICQRNYEVKNTELSAANNRISSIKAWLVDADDRTSSIISTASGIQTSADGIKSDARSIKSSSDNSEIDSKADDIDDKASDVNSDASSIKSLADGINAVIEKIKGM